LFFGLSRVASILKNVESVPGMGGGKIKESDGGVNSTMIYCKNFCKCHSVTPSTTIKQFKKTKKKKF
jgi:hypothetical protein